MNSTLELDMTYFGFIGSTYDALILFEACIAGQIKQVSRRPHDLERERVIQSGSVFIYEENTSGIKRWTDGISWSPSRILGNFLIYRQLSKAFGPGEKKKAIRKSKGGLNGITNNNSNSNGRNKENTLQAGNNLQATGDTYGHIGTTKLETERALIGSLTDSYDFLEHGLVKKTISVNHGEAIHHLVSYYTISDAISQNFIVPSKDRRFAGTYPRVSLISSQNFRNAIEDIDPLDRPAYPRQRDEMTRQSFPQHPTSATPVPGAYSSNGGTTNKFYRSAYNMPTPPMAYELSLPAYTSAPLYPNQHGTALSSYQAPQRPELYQGDNKQRLVMAGSSESEENRARIPAVRNRHQDVSCSHRRDSEDSSVSMSMDKAINYSTFGHNRNSFYVLSQDAVLTANSITDQKTMLNTPGPGFTGQVSYEESFLNGQKERIAGSFDNTDMWRIGNASAGHGHYHYM